MLTHSPRRFLAFILALPILLLALVAPAAASEAGIVVVALPQENALGTGHSDPHAGASLANSHLHVKPRDAPAKLDHLRVEGAHVAAEWSTTNHDYNYDARTKNAQQTYRGENPVRAASRPILRSNVADTARLSPLSLQFVAAKTGSGFVDDAAGTAAKFCSFAGATLVLMADGTKKPIEQVEVGDKVLATDPESGEQVAKSVEQIWAHDDTVIDLVIDGEFISTTEDHRFWNATDR